MSRDGALNPIFSEMIREQSFTNRRYELDLSPMVKKKKDHVVGIYIYCVYLRMSGSLCFQLY